MPRPPAPEHNAYVRLPPPKAGQLFEDVEGGIWKVRRLTLAENPPDFYLVHLAFGETVDQLNDSLILGPREWDALLRDLDLKVFCTN